MSALFAFDDTAADVDGPPNPIPVNELVLDDDIWCGAPNVLLDGKSYIRARAEYGVEEKSVSWLYWPYDVGVA